MFKAEGLKVGQQERSRLQPVVLPWWSVSFAKPLKDDGLPWNLTALGWEKNYLEWTQLSGSSSRRSEPALAADFVPAHSA
jgi:hypothetical protein